MRTHKSHPSNRKLLFGQATLLSTTACVFSSHSPLAWSTQLSGVLEKDGSLTALGKPQSCKHIETKGGRFWPYEEDGQEQKRSWKGCLIATASFAKRVSLWKTIWKHRFIDESIRPKTDKPCSLHQGCLVPPCCWERCSGCNHWFHAQSQCCFDMQNQDRCYSIYIKCMYMKRTDT